MIIHFEKCHGGFSWGHKETTQLHTLLYEHELKNRCKGTNQHSVKEVTSLVTDHPVHLLIYAETCGLEN